MTTKITYSKYLKKHLIFLFICTPASFIEAGIYLILVPKYVKDKAWKKNKWILTTRPGIMS